MFRTVGALYKEQLSKLMVTLRNTNPNFVRCIIPNYDKRPGKIDSHLVLDQLKCNGVLEGIRICRQGFPNRIPFHEFRQRYEILIPFVLPKGIIDGKKAALKMLQELELETSLYKVGQSKIFFRAGVLAQLEEERDLRLNQIMVKFQAHCRGFLARKNFLRRKDQSRAIRIIQRNGLSYLKLRNWAWWRVFTKVKPLLDVTKNEELVVGIKQDMANLQEDKVKVEKDFADLNQTHQILNEEYKTMQQRLQEEQELAQQAENAKNFLERQMETVQDNLDEAEGRLNQEMEMNAKIKTERDIMKQNCEQIESELEDVQAQKQKLQLEKVSLDAKLKQVDEVMRQKDDALSKAEKDRLNLASKLESLKNSVSQETDKAKSLQKQKIKFENSISKLEERLKREENMRHELERTKRRLEQKIANNSLKKL